MSTARGVRRLLRRAGLLVVIGFGLLGGLAASQLLVGCTCGGGADTMGNGITPIPIPGCGAQASTPDGGLPGSDASVSSDAITSPDASRPDLGLTDGGPPRDQLGPVDTIVPPLDLAPAPDLGDGGTGDLGPDGGDLGPDAPSSDAVDGPPGDAVDGPPGDAVDGPPGDAVDGSPADLGVG